MNLLFKKPKVKMIKLYCNGLIAILLAITLVTPAGAFNTPAEVNLKTWGAITAPVYGSSESGIYTGAELFAGPNKFGSYFSGSYLMGKL